MTTPLVLLALPASLCLGDPAPAPTAGLPPVQSVATDLEAVYRGALPWPSFLAAADGRRELWERNWAMARVPAELLERARAAGGPWRILAITEAACSDSVSTIPWLARLAEDLPSLELRVVDSTIGRPWMEAHRSPDGRASTPTVLVLDEQHRIQGCWIEQPLGVQEFWLDVVARGTMEQEVGRKFAWYDEDEGRETLREFVEVLEAARGGRPICPGLGQGG
jgi:hypothetical protein